MAELRSQRQGGLIDHGAALPLLVVMVGLENDRQDLVAEFLTPTQPSPVLHWEYHKGVDVPPTWCVVREGNRYVVCVRGTANNWTFLEHLRGARGRGLDLPGSAMVHRFFSEVEKDLYPKVKAKLAPALADPNAVVHFIGHSYGGALSFIMSHRMKTEYPDRAVELTTWGQPRVITNLYDGERPDPYVRYVCSGDLVPNLPPGMVTATTFLGPFSKALTWISRGIASGKYLSGALEQWLPRSWAHSGDGYFISRPIGRLAKPGREQVRIESMAGWIPGTEALEAALLTRAEKWPERHYTHTAYGPGLIQEWEAAGSAPRYARAVAYLASGIDGAIPPEHLLSYPPPSDLGVARESLGWRADQGPDANQIERGTVTGSSVEVRSLSAQGGLSGNIHGLAGDGKMAVSGIWRIDLKLNGSTYGKTHSVCWKPAISPAGSTSDLKRAYDRAKELAFRRAGLLGCNLTRAGLKDAAEPTNQAPYYQYAKVTDALNPRMGATFDLPYTVGVGFPTDDGNSAANFSGMGLSFSMLGQDDSAIPVVRRRAETFVMFPDSVVDGIGYNGNAVVISTQTHDRRVKAYLEYLTKSDNQFGFMGLDPAISKLEVHGSDLSTEGFMLLDVPGHDYEDGDIVVVTGTKTKVKGRYAVEPVTGNIIRLKGKKYHSGDKPEGGKVQKYALANGTKLLKFFRYVVPPAGFLVMDHLKVRDRMVAKAQHGISFRRRGRR